MGRREPYVDHRDVRVQPGQRLGQLGPALHGGGDLESVRLQQPHQPVPQQEEVFG
ncbi:hypothetical protein ACFY9H_13315 [Streptomyces bacillaris]|uniref:hypothetical protein n=1 Tax=Streptomyces bacillaris TaxID=68179 RepID=UPI0034606AB8